LWATLTSFADQPTPGEGCRTKEAAEELQKERLQQLKDQAAAATSTLGERVQQAATSAQQLARETVEELKKQNVPGAASSDSAGTREQNMSGTDRSAGAAAGEQQQQREQEQEGEGASAESAGQAAGGDSPPGNLGFTARLQGFASAAAREIVRAVRNEEPSASALRGASAKAGDVQTAGTDALAVSQQQQSAWQRQFEDMRSKVRAGV
jgi:uncharacterized protein YdcH (DUF465 family)